MSLREEFCLLAGQPGGSLRDLCRRYGISPTTGYKWLARYAAGGFGELADRSRRPHDSPARTQAGMERQVLALRAEHPCWGGRKLKRVLERDGLSQVPAASTITAILRRHGQLDGPGAGEPRDPIRFEYPEPNDLWQMDFKGHFALDAGRCHPLTVIDDHSRYALEIGACADERSETVQARLAQLFARYGRPRRILADNGPPWGTAGPERHTRLTVWLMDLDIAISHGRPYHPQTQGKDERFHRTLKAEVIDRYRLESLKQAQAVFDDWRQIYNGKRPHEGIDLAVPADRYRPSSRTLPKCIEPPQYEPGDHVRKADEYGRIQFKKRSFRCSKAFANKPIALRATRIDGVYDLHYRNHVLAQIDLRQNNVQPVHHVPEQVSTLSPV